MERQLRRRRRPALSCLECRRRKIKCDRSDPCKNCVAVKSQCTFKIYSDSPGPTPKEQPQEQSSSSRGPPPGPSVYASPLSQGQQTTAGRPLAEYGSDLADSRAVAPGQDTTPNAVDRTNVLPSNHAQDDLPTLQGLLRRVQKLEEQSPTRELSDTGRDVLTRQPGLQDSHITLNKTRTLRYSHWLGIGHEEFGPVYSCFVEAIGQGNGDSYQDAETAPLVAAMGDYLQKCKDISRCSKLGRPSRVLSSPEFGLASLTREVADTMVTLYFQSFESTYRILHAPSFWAEYHNYWDRPEGVTTKVRLKILLVIAIGTSLSDHGNTDAGFRHLVHQWIYAAQTWLSGPLEKDRLDIAGLQIHCLALIARQIFAVGGDLVWISMGSLVHSAMQIGLHRDPKHLPTMPVLQIELRRRLWATILEMMVQASLDTGMPPRISFDEFDTEPPSNNNDEEMDESATVLQPHPRSTFTTTSIQLILLDSLPTRLRILKLLSSLKSEISYQDVLTLSAEITEAYRAYSRFLRENERSSSSSSSSSGGGGGGSGGSGGPTPFHRNMLDYLARRILIPLHCPFAGKARANPLFYYSVKVSVDVALALISPEPDAGFAHLLAGGGVLLREGLRYASSVLSGELVAEVEAARADGTLLIRGRAPPLYRTLLVQAVRDMRALAEERVRRGETNVKNHMFLSMILAQTEAMMEASGGGGVPCEQQRRIAQSGRDSLELCHGLLQTWLGTVVAALPNSLGSSNRNDAGLNNASNAGFDGGGQGDNGLYLDLDYFLPDMIFS